MKRNQADLNSPQWWHTMIPCFDHLVVILCISSTASLGNTNRCSNCAVHSAAVWGAWPAELQVISNAICFRDARVHTGPAESCSEAKYENDMPSTIGSTENTI